MLLEQREDIRHIVLSFAGSGDWLFGRGELQGNQVLGSCNPQSQPKIRVKQLGVLDRVGDAHILGGELDGRPELRWLRSRRSPAFEAAVVFRAPAVAAGDYVITVMDDRSRFPVTVPFTVK